MSNPEIGFVNDPYARWLKPADETLRVKRGDPLPFLEKNNNSSLVFASVDDGLRNFFHFTAEHIDWRLGDIRFDEMIGDALYVNSLLDIAIQMGKPKWDTGLLEQFHTPQLEKDRLRFLGYGVGGSFRAAGIAAPDNYAAVAKIHQKLYGDKPDMMDIDRKLPLAESLDTLLDRVLPPLIDMVSGNTHEQIAIDPTDKDVVFKGVIRVSPDGVPESVVTVRIVRYVHISVLEVRLTDIRKTEFRFPDFTIHVSRYEKDLRNGKQMPASMNTLIPLYRYVDAEDGFSELSGGETIHSCQWMALQKSDFDMLRNETFVHPEVILCPEDFQTVEEALHAGLRAIAEKLQHLGAYKDTWVPYKELLYGDWWKQYRKELLKLLHTNKTEVTVHGRKNEFLFDEIIKLYERLNDYDSVSFLQMAVPMGIMDALEPGLRKILHGYGYMLAGPKFTFANRSLVDGAITLFVLQYPAWRARLARELYEINTPEGSGSKHYATLYEIYRKNKHMRIRGPLKEIRHWI
jgi:hypothetical protein